MCLTHEPIIVHCTWGQVINCRTVSTTGYLSNIRVRVLAKCLCGNWDCVPTTRVFDRLTYFPNTVHLVLVKYKTSTSRRNATTMSIWQVNTHWSFLWLVSHLPTVSEKWASGQYLLECTVPTTWQVSASYKSLSNISRGNGVWYDFDTASNPIRA
jgi:hypothetical protein